MSAPKGINHAVTVGGERVMVTAFPATDSGFRAAWEFWSEGANGSGEYALYEVFDHPESFDDGIECYGPVFVGLRDAVLAFLAENGWEDFTEQASA